MEFSHVPVMPRECIDGLNIRPDGVYVDATTGGGNHSALIAQKLEGGRLICFDRDGEALEAAQVKLAPFAGKVTFIRANFEQIADRLAEIGIFGIDGVLFDLGTSSHQLDSAERGFSYMLDAPLCMRMDKRSSLSAHEVVNDYGEAELRDIFFKYGEEKYSAKIAREIVRARQAAPIESTLQLVDIIKKAMPPAALREKQHPAKRVFQAIRIHVNDELGSAERALNAALELLNPGGRACCVSFHSLEDRLTKQIFAKWAQGCVCPKEFPMCVCGQLPRIKLVSKGAITASAEEVKGNPRARSAKLRIAQKI